MVPTHASFGLMLTACPIAAEATLRAVRQDEYDRCLPTVTAVTCTRISRDSRGMSYERLLRATRLASPRLGAERLDPRGHEAFHDATPTSVQSQACWALRTVTSVAPVVDTRVPAPTRRMLPHDRKRRVLRAHQDCFFRPIREEGRRLQPRATSIREDPSYAFVPDMRGLPNPHRARQATRSSLERPCRRVALMTPPWAFLLVSGLWPPLLGVAMLLR
jgi:hypothetical protein